MATYYPTFRRRTNYHSENHDSTSSSASVVPTPEELATSILIFPTPSSEPASPGVLSSASQISIPTSFPISSFSSPGGSTRLSLRDRTLSTDTGISLTSSNAESGMTGSSWDRVSLNRKLDGLSVELESCSEGGEFSDQVEVWEWSTNSSSKASLPQKALILRRGNRVGSHQPLQPLESLEWQGSAARLVSTHRTRTISTFSHASTTSTQHTPHAPIHIPFISFVQRLLGVDPSTVFLLTHSASEDSSLFVTSPYDIVPPPTPDNDSPDIDPGVKLLRSSSPSEGNALRQGLDYVAPLHLFPLSPITLVNPLVSLIGLVISAGGNACKHVWNGATSPGSASTTSPSSS